VIDNIIAVTFAGLILAMILIAAWACGRPPS
jgi:hypothetical protein